MNIVIGFTFVVLAGLTFYSMQQESLFWMLIYGAVGMSAVGIVASVRQLKAMNAKDNLINQRGKFLASKLAFAWALECMAPQEIRSYIQYDAQCLYLRMLDQGSIPNIKMIREMKNYYLNNESENHWEEYIKRTKKQYVN